MSWRHRVGITLSYRAQAGCGGRLCEASGNGLTVGELYPRVYQNPTEAVGPLGITLLPEWKFGASGDGEPSDQLNGGLASPLIEGAGAYTGQTRVSNHSVGAACSEFPPQSPRARECAMNTGMGAHQ